MKLQALTRGFTQAIEKIKKENERLKEQLAAESQSSQQQTEGNILSTISGKRTEYTQSASDLSRRASATEFLTYDCGPCRLAGDL